MPLPKLTKEFSRIQVFSHLNNNAENFDFNLHVKYVFVNADLRYFNDDCLTDTIILDLGNATLSHVLKNNPVILKKAQTVVEVSNIRLTYNFVKVIFTYNLCITFYYYRKHIQIE